MKNDKVIILYNQLTENPQPDELDVITQVKLVSGAIQQLGYKTYELPFSFQIDKVIKQIKDINPCFIFNLVESIENNGELCFLSPAILKYLQIPYSGVPLEGLFITTNKLLTKKMLAAKNILTAPWIELNQLDKLKKSERYILKPTNEDGSLGLDFDNVFYGNDLNYIEKIKKLNRNKFFIEKYIEGREFNISVLGGKKGPEVMPHAEMLFLNFPDEKPKMMGYSAKWTEETEEYQQTIRTFDIKKSDQPLLNKLSKICIQCWDLFDLKGYARVDFRIDDKNNPYVLEINANPCISSDSGFYVACEKKGYTFKQVMQRIIEDALEN